MLGCLNNLFSNSAMPNSQDVKIRDPENSTLRKVATCLPILGLIVGQVQTNSLKRKLKNLALPSDVRPDPKLGQVLAENASAEQKKVAYERAVQLMTIDRDYSKAYIVNSLLTIALVISAIAINVLSLGHGVAIICASSLMIRTFALAFHSEDRLMHQYEKKARKSV